MGTARSSTPRPEQPAADASDNANHSIVQLDTLLTSLDESGSLGSRAVQFTAHQDRLARSRLGLAASLFAALRCKHQPTAAHCLRVALGCSAWAIASDLSDDECDAIELAGLLHDVGKIGIPDDILLKPRSLSPSEVAMMDNHRHMARYILATCCDCPKVLAIIALAPAWYDGSKPGFECSGKDLPQAARMLSIVDAFDAMTTDHVYRPAMSRERALAELFEFAGSQFDPDLVKHFAEFQSGDTRQVDAAVGERWLHALDSNPSNSEWSFHPAAATRQPVDPRLLFQDKLLENMHDAVVFVDAKLKIVHWNRGAERLTGICAESVMHRRWTAGLIGMTDRNSKPVGEDQCPLAYAVRTGVQSLQRLAIVGRGGRDLAVNVHAVPVVDADGATHGGALLLRDVSSETSLEERCQDLHERATKDPLTQVANRAEFDRVHEQFVAAHLERGLPCSLIISDLDHFKRINDTYGHQPGDEALVAFAQLLKGSCRPGDLVARYGGEEFVILCADCNNAAAARRAEQIRVALARLQVRSLGGAQITASFGVTEIQPGDSPETMLRRADRALLQAKDQGRNRVVQLGDGILGHQRPPRKWFAWWRRWSMPEVLVEQHLVTPVPLKIAVQKLRGFIADQNAEVVSVEENDLVLKLHDGRATFLRRSADRASLIMELSFDEQHVEHVQRSGSEHQGVRHSMRTIICVAIRPKTAQERRLRDLEQRTRQILASLRSYLMASDLSPGDVEGNTDVSVLGRATSLLSSWLGRE
jgi:diguanylate cyclase (GGDEF)-like protein/PAS domain S-box-containing protein